MNNAVVIVTYNRVELLKECLACVCGQTIPFSRVIVVDNHSTDGTAEFLAAREDLDVIREPENLGGAGGFYDGLQCASQGEYDWVLIIDDDAMIAPDYMEKLLDYANAHTGIYGLAGKVVTEGHIDVSHRRRITNRLLYVESNVASEEYQKELQLFADFCYREKRCGRLVCPKRDIFFGTMILNIACACRSAVV
jgi:rhamnopyranosyl-N-acetylglucosaminyl-diphospho-decaprenol beta-1,3/1,4-galactofuranosyltransferase